MQLNEALFAGSDGWVLKTHEPSKGKRKVEIELIGACNLGKPEDVEAGECLEPYATVVFAQRARSESKRSKTIKRVKGDPHEGTAPMWKETISFEYDDEPLQVREQHRRRASSPGRSLSALSCPLTSISPRYG